MTDRWPDIPYEPWQQSSETLHQWLQIVGKFRLAHTPWVNHSWHATFYVTTRGLTSSIIHCGRDDVQIEFDFIEDQLVGAKSTGEQHTIPLKPMSVAEFHERFQQMVKKLEVPIDFHGAPNEVPDPVPFAQNTTPREYDADAARKFWQALLQIDRVFKHFRTGFLGKVSPVHLFWGSFDLAVTRFSGRTAPPHPGGVPALPDPITREAYSHEVSSAGFWGGGGGLGFPAFYSYAYPVPEGFAAEKVEPAEAYFDEKLGEFMLPYDAVRTAADPDQTLLAFLQSTYEAAANLAQWDRTALDAPFGVARIPRALP